MIRVLQINVGVCRAAQDLALATASNMGIDILVLSEPYRCGLEAEEWFSEIEAKAAIVIYNSGLRIQKISPKDNRGFRWVKVEDLTVYACYWSPNTVYTLFVEFLDRLEGSIRQQEGTVIAAADFNAKSPAWGDNTEEPKGRALGDMAASLGLAVCNNRDRPTFFRVYAGGISRSHIDITFVSGRSSDTVRDWQVLDQSVKVRNIKSSFMGTQRATVRLKGVDARKIVEKGRIKIGWVNARVRFKAKTTKCFKCLGYGHIRQECKGPDRSEACCLCAKEGHKATTCNALPKCVACRDIKEATDHFPGSGKCVAYKLALSGHKPKPKIEDRDTVITGSTLENQTND